MVDLRKKIVGIGIAQLVSLAAVMFGGYYVDTRSKVQQQYVEKARAVVLTTESVRDEMGKKWDAGILTADNIRQWAAQGRMDKVLGAIPVVTAWQAAMKKATEGGYEFRVPKFQPRNAKNMPDEVEARVLRAFDRGETEHTEVDKVKNTIRFFRPIKLTKECLMCHGDPATSPQLWGNSQGKDPSGARMENWKVGEVHGAFEVVQSLKEADAQIAASLWKGAGLALVVVALATMLFSVFLSRIAIGPLVGVATGLSTGANEVRTAASQVASSAQALADGASRQAAALVETSGSVEDMGAMIKESASQARDVAALMKQVDSRVEDSNRFLDEMVVAMSSIKDSSAHMSKIIKTIDAIAFQTNILALNAAVEAARAGEAGLGFAVVADEVRNLAQRSAAAAKDTATLIEESSSKASEGQAKVGQVVGAITAIAESIGSVRHLVESLSASSERQAQDIVQVTQAISDIEQVTQSSAAAAEESAAAGQELLAQADYSVSWANALDVMVGRTEVAAQPPRPAPRERTRPGTVLSMPAQRVVEDVEEETPLATGTHGR